VLFESNGSVRSYTLNRPQKLNALDKNMLGLLKPKIEVGRVACAYITCSEATPVGMERVFALWFGRR
jgi:hypothetical protein